jgi:ribosomal-protein-alanine N-acetyltransferase
MTARNILVSDINALYEVEKECFPLDCFSLKTFTDVISASNFLGVLLENNGEILGYVLVNYCLDESDILKVAVATKHRKKGYGLTLLNELKKVAKTKGINKIFLEVREDNFGAIALYEKADYVKISVRKNYYDGKVNALIYQKEI